MPNRERKVGYLYMDCTHWRREKPNGAMGLHKQVKSHWCSPLECLAISAPSLVDKHIIPCLVVMEDNTAPDNLLGALSWNEQSIMGLWDLQWWQMVPCDLVCQSDQRMFVLRDLFTVTAFNRNYWESQCSTQLKCHHLVHSSPCMCLVIGFWSVGPSLYPIWSVWICPFFFSQEKAAVIRDDVTSQKGNRLCLFASCPSWQQRFMLLWPSEYSLHLSSSTLLVWLIDQPGSDRGRKKQRGSVGNQNRGIYT